MENMKRKEIFRYCICQNDKCKAFIHLAFSQNMYETRCCYCNSAIRELTAAEKEYTESQNEWKYAKTELSFKALAVDGEFHMFCITHDAGKWEVKKDNTVILISESAETCICWLNHNELARDDDDTVGREFAGGYNQD